MKKLKFLPLIMLLFAAFNFTSCSEDLEPVDPAIVVPDPTDPTDPVDNGLFKVDIDGTTYTASTTLVYITGGTIQLTAVRASGDNFAFLLDGTTTGTYNAIDNLFAYTQAGQEYGWWGFNPDNEAQNVGSVTITEIDTVNHTISGTFSYTGYWSDTTDDTPPGPKQFTNGVFTDLPYTTDSPTNDTFFAKVNGVDFNQNDLLAIETEINSFEVISVGAENAAGAGITVSVSSSFGPGTHAITGDLLTDGVQIYYTAPDGGENDATSGSVTVTEKTADRIKGTFSGNVTIGTTTYSITAGSFDVAY
jgi:hypothetical protein